MKTLILLLTFVFTFSGISSNAQEVTVANENENINLIFEKIQSNMHVPQAMRDAAIVSSERIRVVFTIDEKGQAHVVDVASNSPELNASVTKQFEAIDFSETPDNGISQYSIWLTFKVL